MQEGQGVFVVTHYDCEEEKQTGLVLSHGDSAMKPRKRAIRKLDTHMRVSMRARALDQTPSL